MSLDITAHCDDCKGLIDSGESVYCAKCAKRETAECCVCRHHFPRFEMFSKVRGVMCHGCAFKYEMEKSQAVKTARKEETTCSGS